MAPWLQRVGKRLNLIVALLCLTAILGIWLATMQRIAFERSQAIEAVMKSNQNLSIAFEQQVYRTLKAAEQVATFVREQYLRQGPDIDLRHMAEEGVIRESMFTIISVVDASGNIVRSTHERASANYADRAFFLAQQDNPRDDLYVSPPVIGRVSGQQRIPMSLRISLDDGRFAGIVVLAVDPVSFTGLYSQADLGERGLLELTGFDGVVRGRKIGRSSSFGHDAGSLAWFQRQPMAPAGSFIDDGSGLDGVKRIVSYRSIEEYPLMVTVGTAYDDELAPVFQRRTYYLLAAATSTAALLIFAGLLTYLLDRQRKASDALQASEALYRATFHQAATGIAHIAPDGRILGANETFHDMLGYRNEELVGRNLSELSDPGHRRAVQQFLLRCFALDGASGPRGLKEHIQKEEGTSQVEKPYRRKDGSVVWVSETLGVVRDPQGMPAYVVAVMLDITARKELEARLSHDAMHDSLTGLPNRVMFQDRLAVAMRSARRHGGMAAVLYIDLDGFKPVNDRYGHAMGDLLLQQVALRLKSCLRDEDTAARFGGDEFGIVLASITGDHDCQVVAKKITDVLSRPYEFKGVLIRITASVGSAVFPTHGEDAVTLVANADAAMYEVKKAGRAEEDAQATG